MSLFNEVTFSTYCRPGELLRVQAADIAEKNSSFQHSVIILSPFERGEASKAGIYDEVLILDDQRMQCLGNILVAEAKSALRKGGDEAALCDFTAAQYLKVWRAAVAVLCIEDIVASPYQNRHGGTSRDHLMKLRSVQAIQRRGRWAVDSSARIYDKPGRLQQTINKHWHRLQAFGEQMRSQYQDFFYGKKAPMPAQIAKQIPMHFKSKSF